MAIKPILFSTQMVRAIISGKKSVTRRVIKTIVPKYQHEDILWVRETWCKLPVKPDGNPSLEGPLIYYKADGDMRPVGWRASWQPSIFMPKEAARIFLRVKSVHEERLQDITEMQAKKEGLSTRANFRALWDEINGKLDGGTHQWDMNPWVWVIEFERCGKPDNFC